MKWAMLAVGGCLVLLAAAVVGATQIRWGGGDFGGYGGAGYGLSIATGKPFSVDMVEFRPSHRVRIESVKLSRRDAWARARRRARAVRRAWHTVVDGAAVSARIPRRALAPAIGAVVPAPDCKLPSFLPVG